MAHERVVAQLRDAGFGEATALAKAAFFSQCDKALDGIGAEAAGRVSVWAPGRIEVFGKHTDYAGGRSLLTAVERGFCSRAVARSDATIRVRGHDPMAGAPSTDFALHCELPMDASASASEGHWSHYVATVVRRVALNFPEARTGVDLAFVSDLPQAAGASSSTALMVSVFLAIAAVNSLQDTPAWRASLPTREDLAAYMGAMEMGGAYRGLAGLDGVGTLGGCQDQTAILCARPDHVVDFGWMPVRAIGAYALPASLRFVVAHSGIVAEKSAGARERYNRVSLMVRHIVASWNATSGRADGSLAAAAESGAEAHHALRALVPSIETPVFSVDALQRRLEQFLLETYTLIPAAAAAFAANDWLALSAAAEASQHAAEEGLGNQIPETTALVRLARQYGAIAASAFGAGFGGSVWALVDASRPGADDDFITLWAAAYGREFPVPAARAMFFSTSAGPAATHWTDADHT
ncbi:MAG: galactokinase family protein [Gemmatimonadota bacterium]